MNPVAFELFGIEVRWYGILIALGMFLAATLLLRFAKEKGMKEDDIYDLLIVVLPCGIIGARIWYVLFNLDLYQGDILRMMNIREGGLAIHGGVIFGVLSGFIYTKIKKLPFEAIADMVAPGLILAQAIGRWGNFMNGEAHGDVVTNVAHQFFPLATNVHGVWYYATFFYESMWNLLGFVLLLILYRRKKFDGQVFLAYGIYYSIGRYFIEGLRTDSLYVGPFRTAQLVSLTTIVVFSILYFLGSRTRKANE
ncbi:prolipoprotein diacylglyceryl transferase [Guggenheimella bovis]